MFTDYLKQASEILKKGIDEHRDWLGSDMEKNVQRIVNKIDSLSNAIESYSENWELMKMINEVAAKYQKDTHSARIKRGLQERKERLERERLEKEER